MEDGGLDGAVSIINSEDMTRVHLALVSLNYVNNPRVDS